MFSKTEGTSSLRISWIKILEVFCMIQVKIHFIYLSFYAKEVKEFMIIGKEKNIGYKKKQSNLNFFRIYEFSCITTQFEKVIY